MRRALFVPVLVCCLLPGCRKQVDPNPTTAAQPWHQDPAAARPADGPPMPKPRLRLSGHRELTEAIAFSPDSQTLASCGDDDTVRLWDLATGREKAAWRPEHDGPMNRNVQHSITAVAFSPDGKTLVISGGLAGNEGSGLRVWDVASGKKLKSLGEPFFAPDQVAYSSDGRFLATSGREAPHVKESEAIIWDPAAGVQRTTLPHPAKVGCLAFVAGNELLATGLPGRYSMVGAGLRLWDVSTGASRGMLGQADRKILSLAASADGRILASLGSDGIARIWDVAARKETARIQAIPKPPPASPQELYGQLALSPDGTTLVVVGSFSVGLWDARTGAQLLNCPHVSEPYRDVAISPDGRTIAMTLAPVPRGDVAEPTSGIDIWNLADLTGRASARGQ